MDVLCSLGTCNREIVGVGVTLADDVVENTLFEEGFRVYQTTGSRVVFLHPVCFLNLFDEMIRQEIMTGLTFFIGPIGLTKEALMM